MKLRTRDQVLGLLPMDHPWVDPDNPRELLSRVYPVRRGALVVERLPLPKESQEALADRRPLDRATFQVYRVESDTGRTMRVSEKTYHSRRGAQYWASTRADTMR